jgi:hypothetical protein
MGLVIVWVSMGPLVVCLCIYGYALCSFAFWHALNWCLLAGDCSETFFDQGQACFFIQPCYFLAHPFIYFVNMKQCLDCVVQGAKQFLSNEYSCVWVCMCLYVSLWASMGSYGSIWFSMGLYSGSLMGFVCASIGRLS